nr:trichohyalin-like [Penaeus vannamei]
MREKDAKAVEMKKEIASLKDAVAKKDEDLETLKVKRQEELQKEEDDRMDIENKATDERRNFNIEQCKLKDRIKKKDLELRHCQAARDRLASDVQERESDVADLREQLGAAQQEVRFLKCRLRDKEDLIEMLKDRDLYHMALTGTDQPTASLLPRTDAGKGLSLQATRDKRPLKAASRSRPLEAERGNRFKTSQEKQVKEKESLQANARREEASTEVGRRSRHLRKEAKSERRVESRPREATRQNRASRTVERNKTRKQKSEDESEQESEDESEQESGDESEQESEDESEQESEDESGVSFRESEDESAGERGRVSAGERVAGERVGVL